jgi:solute carrier family 25 (adenine nucleotide translocator) protein 4/5/6/31
LAYPLDTIRRRLMMESGKSVDQRTYKGTVDCGSKILAKEGITGFFKGNLSNFWRSIGSSIVLVLYDELQKVVSAKGY